MSKPDADLTEVSLQIKKLAEENEEYRRALEEADAEATALEAGLATEEGKRRAISSIPGKLRTRRPKEASDDGTE